MKNSNSASVSAVYKDLPSIDELLRTETAKRLAAESGAVYVTSLARRAVEYLRNELRTLGGKGSQTHSAAELLEDAARRLEVEYSSEQSLRVRHVINATGVIIHTNLGRAPLSAKARRAIVDAAGYAAVEYDLATGTRGKRGARAESLICEVTGAESALIVNNCAAAAFLVLTVLAAGGEVIISRGEMVEIGGDFRVPDVLSQSGAILREVGSTNRTKLADYERAITDQTRMLLRVHPSNYRIIGFASSPDIRDIAALAKDRGIIIYEDAGSGLLIDLNEFGITGEPIIAESISAGVDVVTFSGDKLLGGIQSGIVAGKAELIERIRRHPLYRALRVDKIVYAALEATLESYRNGKMVEEIPVVTMLSMTKSYLANRVSILAEKLENADLSVEIIDGRSVVGGGSAPDFQPETALLALSHSTLSAEGLEYSLRNATPPVIARIEEGKVLIDLRTVAVAEEAELLKILTEI